MSKKTDEEKQEKNKQGLEDKINEFIFNIMSQYDEKITKENLKDDNIEETINLALVNYLSKYNSLNRDFNFKIEVPDSLEFKKDFKKYKIKVLSKKEKTWNLME